MDKNVNIIKKWFSGIKSDKKPENTITTSKSEIDDHWKSFFNHSPDFVIQTNRSGKILYMNRPIYQKAMDQMIGSNIMSQLQPINQDILRSGLEKAFEEGKESFLEMTGRLKNEWFLVRIVPKKFKDTTDSVLIFLTDISNKKLHESDLFGISEFVSKEKEAQKKVLTTISHEIRNPMQVILSYLNFLNESSLNAEQKEAVDNIISSSKSLLFVLNEILDFSKIAAGQFSLKSEPFNLNDLVNQVVDVCKHDAEEKKLILQTHNFHLVVDTLLGDKERLKQVLFHLINNAIKFTDYGRIDISCKILRQNGRNLEIQISVEDTGIGIENENLERIFRSFAQEDEKTSRQYSGLGLGLTISNQIISLMGGKLDVSSEKGKGSRFVLTLVLQMSDEQINGLSLVNYELDGEETKKIRVLLVEDEVRQQKIALMVLKNWNVTIAGNGREAVDLLKKNKDFDLILMDIRMPLMDGIEATRLIRSDLTIQIPIIAVSGEAFVESTLNECSEAGMNDFISKPYEKSTLIESLVRNIKSKPLTVKKKEISILQYLAGKTVLFVEDNLINQKVAVKMFEKLGCKIEIAHDGNTALQIIQNKDFDFFLLDLNLPDMSGFDVSKKIREFGIIAPVIAYSGDDAAETYSRCLNAGMNDLLVKPQKDFLEMGMKIYESIQKVKKQKLYSLDSLINQIGDDADVIKSMVSDFLKSVPISIEKLSAAFSNNDLKLLHATAHNLKTSSLSFGIRTIRGSLILIEEYANKLSTREQIPEVENTSIPDQNQETDLESDNVRLLIKNVIKVLNESCKQLETDIMNNESVKKN